MSALGMDSQGIVRSAFEFKDEFDRTGVYNSPYCCPFCETEYVDKCIANPCKKAPHFSLKSGTFHLNGCNGEGLTGLAQTPPSDARGDAPGRTVVGEDRLDPDACDERPGKAGADGGGGKADRET